MPAALEIGFVILLVVLLPAYDRFVDWPRFLRAARVDPERARRSHFTRIVVAEYALVLAGAAVLAIAGHAWGRPGLEPPRGVRAWASVALAIALAAMYLRQGMALRRKPEARQALAKRLAAIPFLAMIPRGATERRWIPVLALTAGFCEELLYRGFLTWILARWVGWWPAAALSAVAFAVAHAYQGRSGIVRTGIVGVLMTVVVQLTGSLLPAMALHAIIDLGGLGILSMVLSDAESSAATLDSATPQSGAA